MSQKASAIAAGFWRLGIPVVVGPHGTKTGGCFLAGPIMMLTGTCTTSGRTRTYTQARRRHLFVAAETREEAMVLVAKLCMRPNDTTRGRAMKLTHYIDLSQRNLGTIPDDIPRYVRTTADIPVTLKGEITRILAQSDWKERPIPDPTLLTRDKPSPRKER